MKLRGTSVRRVASNHDCAAVMMTMVGMSEIKLDQLDLWVKLQGYYFFLSEEERMEVDLNFDTTAERLNVEADAYKVGMPVLKQLGFIQCLGAGKTRLLRAGEVIETLGKRSASRGTVAA
ncbi:hypothetical protein OAL66_01765 [bacterium]|nr:hypothetical protein [bacterium]